MIRSMMLSFVMQLTLKVRPGMSYLNIKVLILGYNLLKFRELQG